jgi:hypothetical protein
MTSSLSVNFKILRATNLGAGSSFSTLERKKVIFLIYLTYKHEHECKATTLNSIGRPRVSRMETRASKELSLAFASA